MTAGQRWSTERPVKPGWYWWRLNEEADIEMVMVFTQGTYLLAKLYGYTPEKKAIKLSKTGGEWLGPITPDTYHQGRVAGLREAAKEVVFYAYARDAAIAFEIKANKLEQQAQGGNP